MEGIELITTALATGATAAAKDTTKQVIKDSYAGLKNLLKEKFKKNKKPEGEIAVEKFETKPEAWKAPLEDTLKEITIEKEPEIIKAAQRLLELAKAENIQVGKFNIHSKNIQSVTQSEKIENLTQNFSTITDT